MKRLEDLSLEEKIGQMLVLGWQADDAPGPSPSGGYPGTQPEASATVVNAHARKIICEWKVGGVVLMGRNVENPRQVAELTNSIQALADVPVFVTTDQEGGHVCRMKKPFTVMPGNMALGATRDEGLAFQAAKAAGEEMAAIGVHVNFAPTVDVNNNPDNPIIGVRSYGEDPALVARLGAAQVKGYQSTGTVACAKHFPGHGDTAVDSHLGLASLPYDLARLKSVELPPFKAAIDAGVAFVMTAHIIFEALDSERPATLSPLVVDDLLRRSLGFEGVVITDCMEMHAISNTYGLGEAAVMAIEAGVDMLLACHTPKSQATIRQALIDAVRSGRLPEARVDESVRRILVCKTKFGLDDRRTVDEEAVMAVVGSARHRAVEKEIAEKSICLVRDSAGRVPLPVGPTVVIGPPDAARALSNEISSARMAFQLDNAGVSDVQMGRLAGTAHVGIGPAFEDAEIQEVRDKVKGAGSVVVLTKHKEPWTAVPQNEEAQAAMIRELHDSGVPLTVVALRNPYDLRAFPFVPTYLCTLGYTPASLAALAEVLVGAVKPTGTLPVTIPLSAAPMVPTLEGDTTKWGGF